MTAHFFAVRVGCSGFMIVFTVYDDGVILFLTGRLFHTRVTKGQVVLYCFVDTPFHLIYLVPMWFQKE